MLVYPTMLVKSATDAGMKVPPDPDNFDANEFPHFEVFCQVQLNRPMNVLNEHWENAKIIAGISEDDIRKVRLADLLALGLSYSQ